MTVTPELAEVIEAAIESALIDVHTALPGSVESYDPLLQTCNVQLQVKRTLPKADGSYATESLPVLQNVPVQFSQAGDFFVSMPVQAGDTGLVIFTEMSLDQWRTKGSETSPGDVGRHTLTGAVFVPGLRPLAGTITPIDADVADDLVVGVKGGIQLRVKSSGTVEAVSDPNPISGGTEADDFVAMAGKVLSELQNIASNFDSHTHTYNPGPGAPAPTTPPLLPITPPPADVSSSNLKADD